MSSESCVYIADKQHGWLPAHVLEQTCDTVKVRVWNVEEDDILGERTISLNDYPSQELPLQNVNAAGKLMEMPDMVDLPSLHEVSAVILLLYSLSIYIHTYIYSDSHWIFYIGCHFV